MATILSRWRWVKNGSGIILEENDHIVSDACKVPLIFNNLFCSVASEIGLNYNIIPTKESISYERRKDIIP